MFVCECECVTDCAVVCVQMGGLGGCVWNWGYRHDLRVGAEQHPDSMCAVCVAEWPARSHAFCALVYAGHASKCV